MPSELKEDLEKIVGENNVSDSIFERRLYDHDIAPLPSEISLIFKTIPDVVVKPQNHEEVTEVIKICKFKKGTNRSKGCLSRPNGLTKM